MVYRRLNGLVEVLLVHPGGPFWSKKDTWSIPKGETEQNEDLQSAAKREFKEEVGLEPPKGSLYELGQSKQGSGKINHIWAVEGDLDINKFVCTSTFTIEWPPKSGVQQVFPENDRAAWHSLGDAKQKLFKAQHLFIDRLATQLNVDLLKAEAAPTQPHLPSQQETLF